MKKASVRNVSIVGVHRCIPNAFEKRNHGIITVRIAGMRKWRTQCFQMTAWIIKNSQGWVKDPDGEARETLNKSTNIGVRGSNGIFDNQKPQNVTNDRSDWPTIVETILFSRKKVQYSLTKQQLDCGHGLLRHKDWRWQRGRTNGFHSLPVLFRQPSCSQTDI